MTNFEKTVPIVGSPSGDADLRVYNVIVYCGYVESHRHAPLIFQHESGFSDVKEALLHLHESIAAILNGYIENGDWKKVHDSWYEYGEDFNQDVQTLISELQPSTNDGSAGGHEFWEDIQSYGWTYQGNLVTGLCVTITESGENILASKTLICNHCDAYEGKYIPSHSSNDWPMTSDLDLQILIVSKIPRKTAERPGKK